MGTIGYPRGFGCGFRPGSVAQQTLEELAELLVQLRILQIAQAFARDDHDVQTSQGILVVPERFTYHAFQAVALDGELDVLLTDHQTESGVIKSVFARQQQDVLTGNLGAGGVEDCCEVPGSQ